MKVWIPYNAQLPDDPITWTIAILLGLLMIAGVAWMAKKDLF